MRKNKIGYILLSIIFCVMVFAVIYIQADKNKNTMIEVDHVFEQEVYSEKIFGNNEYTEEIEIPVSSADIIAVRIIPANERDFLSNVYISIEEDESNKIIVSKKIASDLIVKNGWTYIEFDSEVQFNPLEKYILRVASDAETEDEAVCTVLDTDEIVIFFMSNTTALSTIAPALILVSFIAFLLFFNYKVKFDKDFGVLNKVIYYDWMFFGFVFAFSSLFFGQNFDLRITAMHAYDLIDFSCDGNFFQYYSCVKDKALAGQYLGNGLRDGANYNILDYMILSVPLMPVYILNKFIKFKNLVSICIIVEKLFLMVCVIYSARLVYQLCEKIGFEKNKSKIVSYFYLCSPVLIFTTTEFGQIDIFHIIFMLKALQYYTDKKFYHFSFVLSIAVALKTFSVLIFIPLILYAEKEIPNIIKYSVVLSAFTLITRLIFIFDKGYSETKEYMNGSYGFLGKILNSGISVGNGSISYFVVALAVICVIVYCISPSDERSLKIAAIYIPLIVFSSFMLFVKWHPQWVSMVVPFMVIAIFYFKENRIFNYLEIIADVSFIIVTNIAFSANVDVYMVNGGLLPMLFGNTYSGTAFDGLVGKTGSISAGELQVIAYSAMVASVVMFCAIFGMKIRTKESVSKENIIVKREYSIARTSVLMIFNLIYMTMYFVK